MHHLRMGFSVQAQLQTVPEDEFSEEAKVIPADRVSDILPDALKILSSAQLTFNNFLSGRGNSEWARVSRIQEYLSILRNPGVRCCKCLRIIRRPSGS